MSEHEITDPGGDLTKPEYLAQWNNFLAVFNGGIDNANIADISISDIKLANISTPNKVEITALNYISHVSTYLSSPQTLSHNVSTVINFDSINVDLASEMSGSTFTTAASGNGYMIGLYCNFDTSSAGARILQLRLNGSGFWQSKFPGTSQVVFAKLVDATVDEVIDLTILHVPLTTGDTVDAIVTQSSGGDLDLNFAQMVIRKVR